MNNNEEKIIEIISEVCDLDRAYISLELSLSDDIGVNSVLFVEILAKIEQAFGCEFDDGIYDLTQYNTVEDLMKIIEKH